MFVELLRGPLIRLTFVLGLQEKKGRKKRRKEKEKKEGGREGAIERKVESKKVK